MADRSPRTASRFLAGLRGVLHLEDGDAPCEAFNLSRTGVLLRGAPPVSSGQAVRLTVESANGDLTLTLDARVIRTVADQDGEAPALGIEFGSLDESERVTLDALISRVVEGLAPASLQSVTPQSSPVEIRRALESISLAHRIALAGRALPREREILIHDPKLQVIDALARNPNLLPREVRTILRMPGLLPHTLESLARDSKWKGDEGVQVMIATHSNVPLALSLRIVDTLGPQGRRRALQSSGLKPAVRARLLKGRRGS